MRHDEQASPYHFQKYMIMNNFGFALTAPDEEIMEGQLRILLCSQDQYASLSRNRRSDSNDLWHKVTNKCLLCFLRAVLHAKRFVPELQIREIPPSR